VSDSTSMRKPSGGAEARRRATQPALHVVVMEQVVAAENLHRAWRQVKANKGAPGIDGMAIEDFPAFAREHWSTIRARLIDGSYRPQPVVLPENP
jgi:RNA-directed DNA polymerase